MSEDSRYPQIIKAVSETPWAILPGTLATIVDLIAFRAQGAKLSQEEIQARVGAKESRRDIYMAGSVAVLPVYGVLVPKADMFSEMSGGSSVQRLSQAFASVIDDENVSAVVMDIDSPGGQTDMIPEFAAEIRQARGTKPIAAVANTGAASAAYWIGSQTDEFVVTPSGSVGSIGVFAAHDDISAMQEKLGVKTTLISAGKFKTESSPFEPLSDDAKEAIQERVDDAYRMFVADVAKGRRVPVDSVRSGYGEGRVLPAKKALAEGMVDRIDTLDAVVQRLSPRKRVQAPVEEIAAGDHLPLTALSFADQAFAVRDAAGSLVERLSSLAEVERGRLTAAKRESLAACPGALRESADAIAEVLAETDPDKHRNAFLSEVARFEALRAQTRGVAA